MSQAVATVHILFLILEVSLQLSAALYYINDGVWMAAILLCVLLPSVVANVISMLWIFRTVDLGKRKCGRVVCAVLHTTQLGLLWRYFKLMIVYENSEFEEFAFLRFLQTFIQNAPYIILQSYLVLEINEYTEFMLASVVVAIFSLSFSLATYREHEKMTTVQKVATNPNESFENNPPKKAVKGMPLVVQFMWRLTSLISRFTAIVLFTNTLGMWILLLLGAHWICLLIWLQAEYYLNRAPHEKISRKWTSHMRDLFRAYVHSFDILDSKTCLRLYKIIAFYIVIIVENTLMVVIWYTSEARNETFTILVLLLMYVCIGAALVFMALNFGCFDVREELSFSCRCCAGGINSPAGDSVEIISDGDMHWDTYDGEIKGRKPHCFENQAFEIQNIPNGRAKTNGVSVLDKLPHEDLVEIISNHTADDIVIERPQQIMQVRRQLPTLPGSTIDGALVTRRELPAIPCPQGKHTATTKQQELSISTEHGSSNSRNTNTLLDVSTQSVIQVTRTNQSTLKQSTPSGTLVTSSKADEQYAYVPSSRQHNTLIANTVAYKDSAPKVYNKKYLPWVTDFQSVGSESSRSRKSSKRSMSESSRHCETCGQTLTYSGTDTESYLTGYSDLAALWPPEKRIHITNLNNLPRHTGNTFSLIRQWLQNTQKYRERQRKKLLLRGEITEEIEDAKVVCLNELPDTNSSRRHSFGNEFRIIDENVDTNYDDMAHPEVNVYSTFSTKVTTTHVYHQKTKRFSVASQGRQSSNSNLSEFSTRVYRFQPRKRVRKARIKKPRAKSAAFSKQTRSSVTLKRTMSVESLQSLTRVSGRAADRLSIASVSTTRSLRLQVEGPSRGNVENLRATSGASNHSRENSGHEFAYPDSDREGLIVPAGLIQVKSLRTSMESLNMEPTAKLRQNRTQAIKRGPTARTTSSPREYSNRGSKNKRAVITRTHEIDSGPCFAPTPTRMGVRDQTLTEQLPKHTARYTAGNDSLVNRSASQATECGSPRPTQDRGEAIDGTTSDQHVPSNTSRVRSTSPADKDRSMCEEIGSISHAEKTLESDLSRNGDVKHADVIKPGQVKSLEKKVSKTKRTLREIQSKSRRRKNTKTSINSDSERSSIHDTLESSDKCGKPKKTVKSVVVRSSSDSLVQKASARSRHDSSQTNSMPKERLAPKTSKSKSRPKSGAVKNARAKLRTNLTAKDSLLRFNSLRDDNSSSAKPFARKSPQRMSEIRRTLPSLPSGDATANHRHIVSMESMV